MTPHRGAPVRARTPHTTEDDPMDQKDARRRLYLQWRRWKAGA